MRFLKATILKQRPHLSNSVIGGSHESKTKKNSSMLVEIAIVNAKLQDSVLNLTNMAACDVTDKPCIVRVIAFSFYVDYVDIHGSRTVRRGLSMNFFFNLPAI